MEVLHRVALDDIERLPPMRTYTLFHTDLPRFEMFPELFTATAAGSRFILFMVHTDDVDAILSAAKTAHATTVWFYAGEYTVDTLIELSKSIDVVITLSGYYAHIVAGEYGQIVQNYMQLLDLPLNIGFAIPSVSRDAWDKYNTIGDGFSRFSLFYRLVQDHVLQLHRKHYLYELENPAELACYAEFFTSGVRNCLAGVFSRRCFSDSRYGVHYFLATGALEPVTPIRMEPYQYKQQYTTFSHNAMMMRQFSQGYGGEDLILLYKERLNECSV